MLFLRITRSKFSAKVLVSEQRPSDDLLNLHQEQSSRNTAEIDLFASTDPHAVSSIPSFASDASDLFSNLDWSQVRFSDFSQSNSNFILKEKLEHGAIASTETQQGWSSLLNNQNTRRSSVTPGFPFF